MRGERQGVPLVGFSRPVQLREDNPNPAYEAGFEAGYRSLPTVDPIVPRVHGGVWFAGFLDGRAAMGRRLDIDMQHAAFAKKLDVQRAEATERRRIKKAKEKLA